jgi:hypothetical protein
VADSKAHQEPTPGFLMLSSESILVAYTNGKYITDSESLSSWLEAAGAGRFQNCSGGISLGGSAVSKLNEWFNTACFSQPAPFTFGNVPRAEPNARWDGLKNFDLAFVKNTSFGPEEKLRLQFRAEFFNIFNTHQFGPHGDTYGTPTFGVVSSQYNNPRSIRFALKFAF